MKANYNAEWTSIDSEKYTDALTTRRLVTYINGTGLPAIVVQDDKGFVYDENGKKIIPSDVPGAVVKAHAIPAPKSTQGVIDLVSKLRGK